MSEKVKTYRELLIWQKGIELVKEIYEVIKMFPKEETYALCDQLRRSAVSIPSNIAEGQARQHTGEFKQFLFIAIGSLAELDTQLVISKGLGYISSKELDKLNDQIEELRRMIRGLISKLTTDHRPLTTKRKLTTVHSPLATNKGFSLVELLIAMVIASVVGLAGISIFSSSNWSQKTQEDVTEAQQNVRVAADRLTKDIRTAGYGLPDPPFSLTFTVPATFVGQSGGNITLTSPITVSANSSAGPDAITILGIGFEAGTLSQGGVAACNGSGDGLLCLGVAAAGEGIDRFFPGGAFSANRIYINLGGARYMQLAGVAGAHNQGSRQLQLGTPATLDRDYPDGTPVYIIQAVQYTINNTAPFLTGCSAENPCLVSHDATELRGSGRQLLAENIEDIQFAYGIDASPRDGKMDDTADGAAGYTAADFLNAPTDNTSIIAVRATVVGRTRNTDIKGQTGFKRPAAEDRTEGTSDGYRRKTLIKVIKIRNPKTGA